MAALPRLTRALALIGCISCTSTDADDSVLETGSSTSDVPHPGDGSSEGDDTSGVGDPSSTSEAMLDTSSGDPVTTGDGGQLSGEQLFAAFCAACHGDDASGTALAYDIRHPDRDYARWIVRNGRMGTEFGDSVMMPFSEQLLPDDDLELVFDFLDAFPQPDTGEGLFLDYCRNCHGADANGGVVGVQVETESLGDVLEQVRDGEGGNDYGARQSYMSAFSSDRLSDDEVAAIVDYVATL